MELRAQVLALSKPSTSMPARERRRPKHTHMDLRAQVLAEARVAAELPPPTHAPRVASPPSAPPSSALPPARARAPMAPASVSARPSQPLRRPPQIHFSDEDDDEEAPNTHIQVPTIVAVEPSPTGSEADPASPVLFEMVTAPAPIPPQAAAPVARPRPRSGTVTRPPPPPPISSPSRPIGARPLSTAVPPSTSDLPPVPAAQRSVNRLSGLPAHPAINRRGSANAAPAPRPMSTFGPLPAVPNAASGPAVSPVRRQRSTMSPLAEEAATPTNGRSPQLPSPEEWQRGWRTPTDVSPTSSSGLRSDLSRSKTMPTRAAPRGPRSSTLISERAKAFDNPNCKSD